MPTELSTELELRRLEAHWDPSARAVLSELRELHYSVRAAQPAVHDLPPFVRAVSALRRWQGRSVFVQDDVNALVLGDAEFGELEPVLLPPGPQLRRRFEAALGNKAAKLDLEAATVLPDGRLLAFGSGSTLARERLVLLEPSLDVRVVDAHPLYEALRAEVALAGSELNLEGAVVLGASLRLVQRGNGARKGAVEPTNAFGDFALHEFLAWLDGGEVLPQLRQVTRVELGHYEGAALSLTDIAPLGRKHRPTASTMAACLVRQWGCCARAA
jgi:hypothetical protein